MRGASTAELIVQRARLWNHSTPGSKVEAWTEGEGEGWVRVHSSQLRLLYSELRFCETLAGILSKLEEFEQWVRDRGKGRTAWEQECNEQSLLQRLGKFLAETVREATEGEHANVVLFKRIGRKDAIVARDFAIAWEVLDLLKMKHQSARKEAQAK